MNFKRK